MTIPLNAAEFAALMAPLHPFEPRPDLAVAVSGGADSLCLALLAADWARARGGRVTGLIVDHRLRPDSGVEAARVAGWLAARGIGHAILVWDGAKPDADIQAAARAVRYALLEQWCAARGVLHLLLGHHRDDQAETLLLRLGRGSGVDGLAAMAPIAERFSLRLLRPLLPVPRARLAATLAAAGQEWIEDPSNRNPAFARARLRARLPELAAEGLSPERLVATARRMARAADALDGAVAELAARKVEFFDAGYALAAPDIFTGIPEEIGLRLLARLVRAVGGAEHPPREERTEALYGRLHSGLNAAATLAGCRVAPWRGRLLFCREAGRMAPPLALEPGAEMVWDGRFRLAIAADGPPGLRVGALGNGAPEAVRRLLVPFPAAVRPTLPAFYDVQGLCVVPHLGYNRGVPVGSVLRWIVATPSAPVTSGGSRLV